MKSRTYNFNNSSVTLIFDNILHSKAEVIVSSDDTGISMRGGVSKHILEAGGEIIMKDARKKLPAELGGVVVSTAGDLQSQKYIFHCLTINLAERAEIVQGLKAYTDEVQNHILSHSVNKCFQLLHALDLTSIAFPCIGAGNAHIPLSKIASVMAEAITANLKETQKKLDVELYLYDPGNKLTSMDYIELFEYFAVSSARMQSEMDLQSECSSNINSQSIVDVPKHEDMSHKIFISYSRADSETVAKLRSILDEAGLEYFIDIERIYSGENFKEVIAHAIDASTVVIFVSSVNSNKSTFVRKELSYSFRQNKTIIPVHLDDSPYAKSISFDMEDINQINFFDHNSKQQLMVSLAYALGK